MAAEKNTINIIAMTLLILAVLSLCYQRPYLASLFLSLCNLIHLVKSKK